MNLFINNHWFIPDKVRTGKKISEIRKSSKNNYTVEKFAASLNVEDKTVYHWEDGTYFPSIVNLEQIKIHYNVSFEDLLLPESCINNEEIESVYEQVAHISLEEVFFNNNDDNYIFKIRSNYIQLWEWWYQCQLFCFSPISNENVVSQYYYLTKDIDSNKFSIFMDDVEKKYGKNYQLSLNDEMKNEILFYFYMLIFKETDSSFFLYRYALNSIDYLCSFNDEKLQKKYINMLPPLLKEIIFNSLINSNNIFSNLIEDLKKDGCKKYNFTNFSIYESQVQNKIFKDIFNDITHTLINLKYEEYLKLRKDI